MFPDQDRVSQIIDELKDHGVSIAEISMSLAVAAQTVYRWWRKAQQIRWRKFYELEQLADKIIPKLEPPPKEEAGSASVVVAETLPPVCEKTDPSSISVSSMCDFCRRRGECAQDKKRFHRSVRCADFFLELAQVNVDPDLSEFEKWASLKLNTTTELSEFNRFYRNLSDDQKTQFEKVRARMRKKS